MYGGTRIQGIGKEYEVEFTALGRTGDVLQQAQIFGVSPCVRKFPSGYMVSRPQNEYAKMHLGHFPPPVIPRLRLRRLRSWLRIVHNLNATSINFIRNKTTPALVRCRKRRMKCPRGLALKAMPGAARF
ncbi:hypothetical protein CHELA1G2_20566 [Hyphomicrobiales bacterium]|nr:hypothetical protein CHELA1G2_20566 [Hyphomicrobiales bacterium]